MLRNDEILVHLHIMKTGGSTLWWLLKDNYQDKLCPHQTWDQLRNQDLTKWQVFSGHIGTGIADHLDKRKKAIFITMLRHPLEQMISLYEFWRRLSRENPDHPSAVVHRTAQQTFLEWVEDPIARDQKLNGQTRALAMKYDYRNLPAADETIFWMATQTLDQCAVVGITEHYNDTIELMANKLGWSHKRKDRKIGETPKRLQVGDLNKDTVRQIAMLQKYDLALYEYANYLFKEQLNASHKNRSVHTEKHSNYDGVAEDSKEILTPETVKTGWYAAERTAQCNTFYWTGPEIISTVQMDLDRETTYKVQVSIQATAAPDILESLRFEVNQHALNHEQFNNSATGKPYFECTIPAAVINGHGQDLLALIVNRTRPANELNPADFRQLGIAIRSITCLIKQGKIL
jgi:hypothetical protein